MTTGEIEQTGKILETKLEAERKHTKHVIEASERRIQAELTAVIKAEVHASETQVTKKLEALAEDMAEFFHKT